MANSPEWIAAPRVGFASLTTENTARNGTGTIVDLVGILGATGGTRILEIRVKATGAVADCLINLFYWDGAAWRFFDDIPLGAKTPSATATTAESQATYLNLLLPSSAEKIGASITINPAAPVNVFALGGNLVKS